MDVTKAVGKELFQQDQEAREAKAGRGKMGRGGKKGGKGSIVKNYSFLLFNLI